MTDDGDLVAMAREGDKSALETLFRKHVDDVFRFATTLTWPNPDSAQDVAQQALLSACENLTQFRGDASFKTWLFGITMNVFRRQMRRQRAQVRQHVKLFAESRISPATDQIVVNRECDELFRQALDRLGDGQRAALYLREIKEFSYKDTASILGISLGATKNRIHAGRNNLKAALLELVGDSADSMRMQ